METLASQPATYRSSPQMHRRLIGLAIALIAVPVLFLAIGFSLGVPALVVVGLLILVVLLPLSVYLVRCARIPRMILSREGIEFRGVLGKHLHLDWDQIERISAMPGHEGLVLRKPLETRAAKRLAGTAGFRYNGAPFYVPEEEQCIAQCRWVPFTRFAGWLQAGTLLEDLRRFAPAIADEYSSAEPAIQKQALANRKVIRAITWSTVAISCLAVLLGLYGDRWTTNDKLELHHLGSVVDKVMLALLMAVLLLSGIMNIRATWRQLKLRNLGYALLWFVAACMQILLAVACLGWLLQKP